MAKTNQDMTPFERVATRLKGFSIEEAEDVAIQILAQVIVKKIYVENEGADYLEGLLSRITKEAGAYADKNALMLAMAKVTKEKDGNEKNNH